MMRCVESPTLGEAARLLEDIGDGCAAENLVSKRSNLPEPERVWLAVYLQHKALLRSAILRRQPVATKAGMFLPMMPRGRHRPASVFFFPGDQFNDEVSRGLPSRVVLRGLIASKRSLQFMHHSGSVRLPFADELDEAPHTTLTELAAYSLIARDLREGRVSVMAGLGTFRVVVVRHPDFWGPFVQFSPAPDLARALASAGSRQATASSPDERPRF